MIAPENKEEADALNKFLKGRKVNVLVGVGSFVHVQHCFELGFPDTMVLIDPAWANEKAFASEINRLEHFADKDVPLKFIYTSSTEDIVEFFFGGQKKTVHFYKIGYNPGILGRFQPDVFHMGHAVIGSHPGYLPFEPVLESMLLLPKGTIIMNIDGGCTQYPLSLKIYANYFLTAAAVYQEKGVWSGLTTNYIYEKTRDIDEKENILVYKFARALDEMIGALSLKPSYAKEEELLGRYAEMLAKEKEEALSKGVPYEEPKRVKNLKEHKKSLIALPKTIAALWDVFNDAQKKKLIKLMREFAGRNKERIEEAIKILNLE